MQARQSSIHEIEPLPWFALASSLWLEIGAPCRHDNAKAGHQRFFGG